MQPLTVSALLTDAAGSVLLVRRKDFLLWGLPGGDVRVPVSWSEMLAGMCRRQIGVTPDFVAPFREFTVSGVRVILGTDDIPRDGVRACGRIAEARWCRSDDLPVGTDPIARMAIALEQTRGVPRWSNWTTATSAARPNTPTFSSPPAIR